MDKEMLPERDELIGARVLTLGGEPSVISDYPEAEAFLSVLERCDEVKGVYSRKKLDTIASLMGLPPKNLLGAERGFAEGMPVVTFALASEWTIPARIEHRGRPKGVKNKPGHKAGRKKGEPSVGSGMKPILKHVRSEKSCTLQIQVVESTKERVKQLKASGFDLEYRFEQLVDEWWSGAKFGDSDSAD